MVPLFFFQAEDGIRDLVRSRGLGDVYKRQDPLLIELPFPNTVEVIDALLFSYLDVQRVPSHTSVSYTHLTLPTSDLV